MLKLLKMMHLLPEISTKRMIYFVLLIVILIVAEVKTRRKQKNAGAFLSFMYGLANNLVFVGAVVLTYFLAKNHIL